MNWGHLERQATQKKRANIEHPKWMPSGPRVYELHIVGTPLDSSSAHVEMADHCNRGQTLLMDCDLGPDWKARSVSPSMQSASRCRTRNFPSTRGSNGRRYRAARCAQCQGAWKKEKKNDESGRPCGAIGYARGESLGSPESSIRVSTGHPPLPRGASLTLHFDAPSLGTEFSSVQPG
jgi:hypothetical protein